MADISKEIQDFQDAVYGEEVRGSMISLAEKVNREATDASQAAVNASSSAGAAASNAQLAVNRADTAAQNANQAAQNIQDKADAGDFTGSVQIGTVTTGEPGSKASVSNSGTDKDAVLDITIPRGNQGISFRMREAWAPETDYVNDSAYIDIVSYNGSAFGCLTSHQSSELVTPANTAYWQCLAQKGDTGSIDNIDDVKIGFTKAENRANISPEDTLAIILGKVEKIYADLKAVAFSGKYSDLSGTLERVSDLENDAGYVTENTWKANAVDSEGYVEATGGKANQIYRTDAEGNPGWQDGIEIDEMAGATAEKAGAAGIVPAPAAGMQDAFLRGDATWGQLGAGAFAESANNLATTQEGFYLDARQGKELADQLSLVNSACSAMIDQGRYTVNANQEISFQIYDNSVYLIGTLMSVYTSRSLAVVFGGNGNQVNVGQKATIIQLVTASNVTYSVSEETGKFNQIIVKNNSVYSIVVLIVDLSGRNFVRL